MDRAALKQWAWEHRVHLLIPAVAVACLVLMAY